MRVCVRERERENEPDFHVFDVSKPSVVFIKVLSRSCVLMIIRYDDNSPALIVDGNLRSY